MKTPPAENSPGQMSATAGSKLLTTSLSFRRLVDARLRNEEMINVRWSGLIHALAIPTGDQELAGVIEVMGHAPDADGYVGAALAATTPTPRIAMIPIPISFAVRKERYA